MAEDPMVEEFFSELNDKYYPQILEGLELLEQNQVLKGIEELARPLHTIKGVTGFMAGFEYASTFTHKIEDYLKKVQADEVAATPENVVLLSRGVNMIFQVCEQLRESATPDETEPKEILELIALASEWNEQTEETCEDLLSVEETPAGTVVRILSKRVHLEPERRGLSDALARVPEKEHVLLDLTENLTFGSAAWETVAAFAATRRIAVCGLNPSTMGVFYTWGINRHIQAVASHEAWANRQSTEALNA